MSDGVTGNTSGFGPEESRFEPWSDNESFHVNGSFFVLGKFQKDSLKKPLSKTEGLLNYYFLN